MKQMLGSMLTKLFLLCLKDDSDRCEEEVSGCETQTPVGSKEGLHIPFSIKTHINQFFRQHWFLYVILFDHIPLSCSLASMIVPGLKTLMSYEQLNPNILILLKK